MKLKILVGSMTGTASLVAQAIQMDDAEPGCDIDIERMDGLDISMFSAENSSNMLYLVCTSTYGAGDVPDNALSLYESLASQPQFLGHVHYGVIALGDSGSHPHTFCFGGKKFDERLQDLGAQRIGEICCLDASSGMSPETEAIQWCRLWLKTALQSPGVHCVVA
jgi:MioC protein